MKHNRLPVLCLIVLLLLAACGGSEAAPAAVAEVAPTTAPTEPPPTEPPPTATPAPTNTPRPTATPAPTEPVCDIEQVREAAENASLFETYTLSLEGYLQMPGEQLRQPVLLIDSAVAMSGGQLSALEMTFDSAEQEEPLQMILVDGLLYFRPAGEPWQVATEMLSAMLSSQVDSAQTIDVGVMEVVIDYPCAPFSERVDGRDADGFRFTEVDLAELAAVSSSAANLGGVPAEDIRSTEFLVWVAEVEDVPVVVKWQFNIVLDVDGEEALVETSALVGGFNEPVDIRAPEGVTAVAFPLELPRPDDALIYLEDATALAFFTAATPEEMQAFYVDALTADGWTAGESRQETTDDGRVVEVQTFTRGDEQLEMAIIVTEGETLVAFTLPQEE